MSPESQWEMCAPSFSLQNFTEICLSQRSLLMAEDSVSSFSSSCMLRVSDRKETQLRYKEVAD